MLWGDERIGKRTKLLKYYEKKYNLQIMFKIIIREGFFKKLTQGAPIILFNCSLNSILSTLYSSVLYGLAPRLFQDQTGLAVDRSREAL